jgi:hypothetical protein
MQALQNQGQNKATSAKKIEEVAPGSSKRIPRSQYGGSCAKLAERIRLGNTLPDTEDWMGD